MSADDRIVDELWFQEEDDDSGESEAARNSLAVRLAELEGLKPFPAVAQRVVELLSDPNFQQREVQAAIEEDPALASRVLRVANSAAFAGAVPCDSVGQAIVRLGAALVRELILGMSLMDFFQDVTGHGQSLRDHSVTTAAVARILARDYLDREPPGVYLSALLHDVGKLLLLQSGEFPHDGMDPVALDELDDADGSHEHERTLLGYDHAILGGHAVMLWRLPHPVPQALSFHHQFDYLKELGDERLTQLVAIVRLADQLDRQLVADPPPDKKALKRILKGPEATCLGVDRKILLADWSELFIARAEAASLYR